MVHDRQVLEKTFKDLFVKQRKLQEDYFEKGLIDRKTFDKRTVELETEITKLKAKLIKLGINTQELIPKEA